MTPGVKPAWNGRDDYSQLLAGAIFAAEHGPVAIKERRESVDRIESEIRDRFGSEIPDVVVVDTRQLALWIRDRVGPLRKPRS